MRTTLVLPKVILVVVVLGILGLWGCSSLPFGSFGGAPVGYQGPTFPGGERTVDVTVSVSKPSNGSNFAVKDKPVVTVTLRDASGKPLTREDFATLNLYMYGPQETAKTVTAVKMLNASTDRTQTPHHYIDLIKNPDVKAKDNVLTYELKPVGDEEPGTYTVSVWAVQKDNGIQQTMALADLQIRTATVEKQIVEKDKCASCHLGASSGKLYFAHVDPGRSPTGNWSLDFEPVRTCKSCHNNDGYAAYAGNIEDPTGPNTVRTPDPIVRRVHGVHFGEELQNSFNNDPKTGNFRQYAGVVFPANVKNCAACHVDERWKTQPSRQACGACHDNIWFGDTASMPKTFKAHPGGPRNNDNACGQCHTADDSGKTSIAELHKVEQVMNKIDVSLTPPRNGKFYVAGEKPVVTLVIRDDKGTPIDHTKVDETTFSTASLFVYGPRYLAKPVLTNIAKNRNSKMRASATNAVAASGMPTRGWTFAAGDTFKIAVNRGPVQVLAAPDGLQTPDQVRDWLRANLKDVTVASNNTAGTVNILSNIQGDNSRFEIYDSPVTAKMGWKPGPLNLVKHGVTYGKTAGTTVEPFVVMGAVSTAVNDLRPRSDPLIYTDPLVTRTAGNITYPLDDVTTVQPGTYMIYVYHIPNGVLAGTLDKPGPGGAPNAAAKALNMSRTGIGFTTFQVGRETPDKKVATNCTDCHADTIWHLDEGPIHAEPFDTDYCLACHDYDRVGTGDLFSRVGGNSTAGWAGYGAKPIALRVHGVHRGAYLTHPDWIYAGNPNAFNEVIFPQDIRNCTKCHSADTTGTWKTEASRSVCTSCHDSPKAIAHTNLMTENPNPSDPYDAAAVETCQLCHGAGRDFSPDKVHSLTPYKPPYPREE